MDVRTAVSPEQTTTHLAEERERGDLVGCIVWEMVSKEVRRKPGRALLQLTALKPAHLLGVSRYAKALDGKSVKLAISDDIDPQLSAELPAEHRTDKPAVHFRNSDEADVILFAVSDDQRDTVGASLNPVARIDRKTVQDAFNFWRDAILGGGGTAIQGEEHRNWIDAMLIGLTQSGVTKDLDQYAEFVCRFRSFSDRPLEDKLRLSAPALRLPKTCFATIPSRDQERSKLITEFRAMFRTADREVSNFAYLLDSKDLRIASDPILEWLDASEGDFTADKRTAASAIRGLIADRKELRHGEWRNSQVRFCEDVEWNDFGKSVFGVKTRKETPTLSQRTRKFIEDEFPNKLDKKSEHFDASTASYLDELTAGTNTVEEDRSFFEKWQDVLRTDRDKKLYELWRRHLFTDEVKGADLISVLVEGVRSLLIKTADDGKVSSDAKIAIRVKNGEKTSTWSDMQPRIAELLRIEGRLIEAVLSKHVKFEFGKWLSAKAEGKASGQAGNQVEFELRLIPRVSEDGAGKPQTVSQQQVRAFWQPGAQSIALAWPEDINELYKGFVEGKVRVPPSTFDTKQGGTAGGNPASLIETTSFTDVAGGEFGRTANPTNHEIADDFFTVVLSELHNSVQNRTIDLAAEQLISTALDEFRADFSAAIAMIRENPADIYESGLLKKQAESFGTLCKLARERLAERGTVREGLLKRIVEFGIVRASAGSPAAIIPAWHPLRLLEREAKARDLATFIDMAVGADSASVDGLERAADEQKQIFGQWFFPRVLSLNLNPYVTVEDCGGYSLAVPVGATVANEQKLEATAEVACREFVAATDRFIELNPHEEGNFSSALYNSDSVSLAGKIANELERRMARQRHLRCSLLITHDDAARLREVYSIQNTRLTGENLDEVTEGFLSRLRVGVGRGDANAAGRRSSTDVVFLHEAFFRHAEMAWEFVDGESDTLSDVIDFRNAALPRRRTDSNTVGGISSRAIEIFMSASRPPRAAAHFTDLCFTAHRDVRVIKDGSRAVPIQRLSWDNELIRKTIKRAHELGDWVVSVDTMSSRQMLADNGIKVIRDVQLPDIDMRVLVSSREPSHNLLRHLRADFEAMQDPFLNGNAGLLSQLAISTVVEVCGQKVLSSARSRSTAREIVGLAAATTIVNHEKSRNGVTPVWFSLDDNRAFFGLKGTMADTLALSVRGENGHFIVEMTVVEAKCVGKLSESLEAKSSRDQVASTFATIDANFVSQDDPIARRAWGLRLLYLMSLRPDYIQFFKDNRDLEAFRHAIAEGAVTYVVDGRSIVVVHDDVSSHDELSVKTAEKNDAVWQYTVRQRAVSRLMTVLYDPSSAQPLELPKPNLPDVSSIALPQFASKAPELTVDAVVPEVSITPSQVENIDQLTPASISNVAPEEMTENGYIENSGLPKALEQQMNVVAAAAGVGVQREAEEVFAHETATNLQAALTEFGMTASFFHERTISTPNGVLVNFAGHSTLTVAKLQPKLLELRTTHGLDVTDIRTGLGRISLFVAAPKRRIVDMARVWLEATWPSSVPESIGNFLIGLREDTGEPLWLNLLGGFGDQGEHAPHTLIAGETNSGKGVLTQNLLLQMVALSSPKNLKLYLIDPKFGVDFPWIADAPHLVGDIITDQSEAEEALNAIVAEMERRYVLIRQKRVPKISEYNATVRPEEQLPYIYVVHDEMADWMASSEDYRKMIQSTMTRLASKARACGIHVIMITQRAAQDAIPVGIRDNLGNRLILKVAGEAGSVLALGVRGAERLLGKGHLAARLGGDRPPGEEYFVVQVPYANTKELSSFAEHVIRNLK